MSRSSARTEGFAFLVNRVVWGVIDSYRCLYFFYKRTWEDGLAPLARRHPKLFAGGHLIDVGANIGYSVTVLRRPLGSGFSIFAFEPESINVGILRRTVQTGGMADRVTVLNMAVGDREGTAQLGISPRHPGDHRVVGDGKDRDAVSYSFEVPMTTIDAFVSRLPAPSPIAFVKVDVQGFEPNVLRGMTETLERNPGISVFLEFTPAAIRARGEDPLAILASMTGRGFRAWEVGGDGKLTPFGPGDAAAFERDGKYADLLFSRRDPA